MSVGWGIMATGGIADLFAKDLALDGRKLVAVGSRDQARARAFADKHGVSRAHGSYLALARDPEVDVVYVATPHTLHLECALMAIEAGKHVLVEKPLTVNAAQAQVMAAAAKAADVICMEAMWTRFLPHMARLRTLLDQGVIGQVTGLMVDHTQLLPSDPHHRLNNLALGGGALLDLGVYPVSFAYDLFGAPELIEAPRGDLGPTGADKQVSAVFVYGNGARAYWVAASNLPGPNRACVIGSEGRVELNPVWYMPTSMKTQNAEGKLLDCFDGSTPGRGMQFQAREIEHLIAEGHLVSRIMPLWQSVEIMETMDQLRALIGVAYPADAV
ncbi:MAG: Gfo/Idh/MocA family oxidoreductase [Bifidobacteriaceae bacterium]|jgi:predicted dehydrogenase|nr:Gfo/Idh/MocA family oxidoreductase [Bifidobacteriaceae bacterium]